MFPATATLLDAKRCPLDKFDALFAKITQERRIRDGYFRQDHDDEARLLFVVNGSPYGAGRVAGGTCTFLEVHEFFTAYAQRPDSPLSFLVADKRLLLGLMVLFQHEPTLSLMTDRVDMVDILEALAERKIDQVLALRAGDAWGVSLASKGRLAANFLVPRTGLTVAASEPAEQLVLYARDHADGVAVDVYETTRVEPASDVILVTPETRGRLVDVFLRVAARVREEEAAAPVDLEAPPAEVVTIEADDQPPPAPVEAFGVEEAPPTRVEAEASPLELERPPEPAPVFADAPSETEPAATAPAPPPPEFLLETEGELRFEAFPLPSLEAETPPVDLEAPPPASVEAFGVEEAPPTRVEAEASPLELERPPEPAPVFADAPSETEPAQPAGPVPELLLFVGDKHLGTFSLASGEATIGRTPNNTIIIDNAGVSRRHAVIRLKDHKAILEDLGSANGTFVRGQKVQEHALQDGDEIVIVKHRLVYRIPEDAEAPPKTDPLTDVGQRTMYIDATAVAQAVGSRPGVRPDALASTLRPRLILPDLKKFALDLDEVNLGTAMGCQVQLSGMFVGKVHAKIVRTKEGQFRLQHLSGLAATRVNGEKVTEHLLKHGDEIEIGKQKLLFRLER
jgi:pSer/pThr/pTyr-binding forkhead associated (FHA) protein